MSFIDQSSITNDSKFNLSESYHKDFDIGAILFNNQSFMINMEERMNLILAKFQEEMNIIKQENKNLNEIMASQEIEIRKLKQKNYQFNKYLQSNNSFVISKIKEIEIELQKLDSDFEVLKVQNELIKNSGLKTTSYKTYLTKVKT